MEGITNWPQAFSIVGMSFCVAVVLCVLIWKNT